MAKNIFQRMTFNVWKKDKFGAVSFSAFVAISVMLFSLTVLLFSNLLGAINNLMDIPKTPDYLQTYNGVINEKKLEEFASKRTDIENWQICSFLNLENSTLLLGGKSFQDNTQDNGLCVQGKGFDLLLDLNNEMPKLQEGEVYVPVCYESEYDLKIGDFMQIGNERLIIAGFIRDSQMNSMMASSKRFLVCKNDYDRLKKLGSEEYLIEYLLKDDADITKFQSEYENSEMPSNGLAITKPLIKLMNVLSDGIMIMIILLISVLVLIISLICIRFMLLTRLEGEKKELGILKAIGISKIDIRKMFMKRYLILIICGAIIGLSISFLMYKPLSKQMQSLYGVSEHKMASILFSIIGTVILSLVIMLFVKRLLSKINKMTALEGLNGIEKGKNKSDNKKICISFVIAIGVFLMLIPANLYSTLSSPKFVTYMGIGDGKYRIDIRTNNNLKDKIEDITNRLDKDNDVDKYSLYQTVSLPVICDKGENIKILVEMGEHTNFPVTYSIGEAPKKKGEIALSYLLAQELEVTCGDSLALQVNETPEKYLITGIYSDITNGGKTAKMYEKDIASDMDVMWSIAYATLKEGVDGKVWLGKYEEEGVKAVDINSYVEGTYGQTVSKIKMVSILIKVITAVVMILVISLFLRLLIERNRHKISIKKAIGFTTKNIKMQYAVECIKYCLIGVFLGVLLGNIAGEKICAIALKSFGADGFKFIINPIELAIFIPIITIFASILAIGIGIKSIKNISAVECCRERG